jgi:hypothetical protein
MSVEGMPDQRLACYYDNIRQQVEAERACEYKFMTNPTVHQYADQLRSEMIKRRLKHSPIEWPEEMARKYREVVDEERQQESNPVATGAMSAFRGNPKNICSIRVLPVLTHLRHPA